MPNDSLDSILAAKAFAARKGWTLPQVMLFSRRYHKTQDLAWDSVVFKIDETSTETDFVAALMNFKASLFKIISENVDIESFVVLLPIDQQKKIRETTYDDRQNFLSDVLKRLQKHNKEARQNKKFWKFQKMFHASIANAIPPSLMENYYLEKFSQSLEEVEKAKELFKNFINSTSEITATINKCKRNADGQIVIEITIDQEEAFVELKKQFKALSIYKGYDRQKTNVEYFKKEATLAIVLGVIDPDKLNEYANNEINTVINSLDEAWSGKKISLHAIAWLDVVKRTLSANSCLKEEVFYRASSLSPSL